MKKLPIILVALTAAAALTLGGCQNSKKPSDANNDAQTKQEDQTKADYGDNMSLEDAEKKLAAEEAKTDLDNEVLLTVDGIPFSASTVKFLTIAINENYASSEDSTEDTTKAIADEIESNFRLDAALINFSKQYGAGISADDYTANVTNQISTLKSQYGDDYASIIESYTYETPYLYFDYQLYNSVYASLFDKLYGKGADEANCKEIFDKSLKELQDGDYARAKHILIQFPEDIAKDDDGNITDDAAKAETLAKAQAVLDRVNKGEDFDALVKECGEDPGMTQNPDGYYFKKGDMVQPFEDATYALEIGGISGLVETSYGYHIIQRLDLNDEALKNSEIYQNYAYTELRDKITKAGEGYEIKYEDSYEKRAAEFLQEYKDKQAAESATTPTGEPEQDTDEANGESVTGTVTADK